jgi:hypothetical protein
MIRQNNPFRAISAGLTDRAATRNSEPKGAGIHYMTATYVRIGVGRYTRHSRMR